MQKREMDDVIARWSADLYDAHETQTDDVDFVLALMEPSPKRLLEVACGSGRMLVPLAKAGHRVMGLDCDARMLEKIGPKAEASGCDADRIAWRQADAVLDGWGTGYDVVLLAANFLFNIVSDVPYGTAQEGMILKAADALHPGGHLFIDYAYTSKPSGWFDHTPERVIWEGADRVGNSGRMVILNSTYDPSDSMVRFLRRYELTLANGTSVVKEIPSIKHFASLEQIRKWLSDAGFIVEREMGDYQGNPIGADTSRVVLWARKA